MQSTSAGWRDRRRALVKEGGRRVMRGVTDYLGRQSLIPNDPVLDPSLFPFADDFRARWREVRAELDALLERRDELPRFQDISPDQYRISPDDRWRTVVFYGFGKRFELASRLCPVTASLLDAVPKIENAFFSILAPGKVVPLHQGVTKGMVRCHLGLKVPADASRCTMDVGPVRCSWREGELLFFDDTYPHGVHNDTNEERAVLLFDFERPMTRSGQAVSRALLAGLRRTAYFHDALANQKAWEQRFTRPS
jgi:ornithine lipid ester-linked acyl 2-hydroxylase